MTRRITVDVYAVDATPANPLVHEGTLASDKKRAWLDDLIDTGSYTVETKVGHADEALASDGRLLRFSIAGSPCWWALIEPRDKVSADPQARQAGRVISLAGRGGLAVLEQGIVFPELDFGFVSPDTRWVGWMSKDYDDSGWGAAVELKQQSDVDPAKPWYLAPLNWPDPNAWWVGPAGGDTPPIAAGNIYLRGGFTVGVGEGGEYQDNLTADDGFELYWDASLKSSQQGAGLWGETQKPPVNFFDEGPHVAAVKVINFDRPDPSTNVMGFIFSVTKLLGGGVQTGPVVTGSSSGTKMLAFPVTEPGMTPGHIMKVFIDENQSAGAFPFLHYDFTATHDSAGVAWPKEINRSFAVGTTVLDVARSLTAEKLVYFRIKPNSTTFTLQAFVSPGADLTGSVAAVYASNIAALKHHRTAVGANTLASRTAEGRWRIDEDAGAVTTWGRRFATFQLGTAPSDGAAADQAAVILAEHAQPSDVITGIRIEAVTGAVPYVDFIRGDSITAPKFDESAGHFLVTGVHVSEDDDAAGNVIFDLDMESTT